MTQHKLGRTSQIFGIYLAASTEANKSNENKARQARFSSQYWGKGSAEWHPIGN